jgi:hypothetical protein
MTVGQQSTQPDSKGSGCFVYYTLACHVDKFWLRRRLNLVLAHDTSRFWTRYSALTLVVIGLTGCDRAPATLDEVIERNTKAMGGRAAIEAVKSIQVDLHIVDPGFEVDGIYRAARPGRMRIDAMMQGKHVFTETFNGQRGWEWSGKGNPVAASDKATAALRHGVELPGKLFGLHELRQRGHRLELVGRESVDGINYHVVRLTMDDGYATTLYVEPERWLITRRRDFRPLHVDIDPTPAMIEQRSSDFREISGVQFAFANTEVDLKTGKILETTKVNRIEINPSIDPSIFEKL